ncbi:hypothetical protein SRHO_G00212980 [Serrasalmus rhombeus]
MAAHLADGGRTNLIHGSTSIISSANFLLSSSRSFTPLRSSRVGPGAAAGGEATALQMCISDGLTPRFAQSAQTCQCEKRSLGLSRIQIGSMKPLLDEDRQCNRLIHVQRLSGGRRSLIKQPLHSDRTSIVAFRPIVEQRSVPVNVGRPIGARGREGIV